ncbi:uncharacterized protein MONOS_17885 [Monocercomonoides exilis]|uniref:uncharacterized protein n=1 Tax=Monocercomonoides exilis TaxID=2049356 RepID=UPI00355A447B|nr:hypothetical protein MONOS_17885 [Monocercomonoides exilis]
MEEDGTEFISNKIEKKSEKREKILEENLKTKPDSQNEENISLEDNECFEVDCSTTQRKSKIDFMKKLPSLIKSSFEDSQTDTDDNTYDCQTDMENANSCYEEFSSSLSTKENTDDDEMKDSESTETNCDFQYCDCHPSKIRHKDRKSSIWSAMQSSKRRKVSVLVNDKNLSIISEKLDELEKKEKAISEKVSFESKDAFALDFKDLYGNINATMLDILPDNSSSPSTNPALTTQRYAYDSPTKFSDMLRSYSREELQPYVEKGLPFCDETVKTHKWVCGMFIDYCKMAKKEPFPLKAKPVYGFMKLLGTAVGYSVETIKNGIRSSLFNISETKTGKPVKDKVRMKVHRALMEIKTWIRKRKKKGLPLPKMREENENKWKKQPLIVSDLQRILECYPDWIVEKPQEASLFLFALSTGARAQTCAHIRLKDIIRVYSPPNSNFIKVTFNLECGKGWNGDNHCVTVEGAINEKHQLNVIWWLEQYLVEEFGLSLTNFDKWELKELEEQFIWQLRKGAMRVRLKKRAVQAGYPDNLFGFHSFRSGFICSALLKAGENQEKRKQVLEATAFVGNWAFISKSQWEYVKETEKAVIIGNRLGFQDEAIESDDYYDMTLTSPAIYHNIKLNEPIWKEESIILAFDFYVLEIIKATCSEFFYPYNCVIRLNRLAASSYLNNHNVKCEKGNTFMKQARIDLLQKLKKNKNVVEAVRLYLAGIQEYLNGSTKLKFHRPKEKVPLRENRPINKILGTKIKTQMDSRRRSDTDEKFFAVWRFQNCKSAIIRKNCKLLQR